MLPKGRRGKLHIPLARSSREHGKDYVSLQLMDQLALVNSTINFFVYCMMSSQFRDVFFEMISLGRMRRAGSDQTTHTMVPNNHRGVAQSPVPINSPQLPCERENFLLNGGGLPEGEDGEKHRESRLRREKTR